MVTPSPTNTESVVQRRPSLLLPECVNHSDVGLNEVVHTAGYVVVYKHRAGRAPRPSAPFVLVASSSSNTRPCAIQPAEQLTSYGI